MRFVVIYLVLALVIYVRGICPVVHDRRKRLWCLLAVLPGAFFPSVTRFIGGSMVAPDLPVWVMYAGSIFQNFTLLVGILVIGREILSIPLRIIGLPFLIWAEAALLPERFWRFPWHFPVWGCSSR